MILLSSSFARVDALVVFVLVVVLVTFSFSVLEEEDDTEGALLRSRSSGAVEDILEELMCWGENEGEWRERCSDIK